MAVPHAQKVEFEGTNGPASAAKSAAILDRLEGTDDFSELLRKHLAYEQAVNADSPLSLGNRLTLLQNGPATYQAMFAAMREATDHINLETYIFDDGEVGTAVLRSAAGTTGGRRPGQRYLRQRRGPDDAGRFLRPAA